ncbi:MAG: hypothetical protein Q9200_007831, partial [Gallowayella weberi]
MRVVQALKKPLNAEDLYICAIEAMYHWALEGYEEETQTHDGHSEIIRGLQISYHDVPERPINIHWEHLILAVLIALNSMDQRHVFAETIVEMKQHEKLFGIMRMGKQPTRHKITASSTNTTNNFAATARRVNPDSVGVNNTKTAVDSNTEISKTIIVLDAPYLGATNITYQRFGTAVNCKLLFSTALDGIAYAAPAYWIDTWPYSTTYDWLKKMMYQTVE